MGHGRSKSSTSYEKVPVVVPDFHVSGTLTPDCSCNYFLRGILNGRNYYQRGTDNWFLWWTYSNYWYITQVLGAPTTHYWEKYGGLESGIYTPRTGALGIAIVSPGGH